MSEFIPYQPGVDRAHDNDGIAVRPVTNFSYLAADVPPVPQPSAPDTSADEALLLTKVNVDLHLFDPAEAERAPEVLAPAIRRLHEKHPGRYILPFVVHELTSAQQLRQLLEDLHPRHGVEINPIWTERYAVKDWNRRALVPWKEPKPGSLRGILVSSERYPEETTDLIGMDKEQQRHALRRGEAFLNVIDWIVYTQICNELGEDVPDDWTITRFPQMPSIGTSLSSNSISLISPTVSYRGGIIHLDKQRGALTSNKLRARRSLGL